MKLKIQKYKQINLCTLSKITNKTNLPLKLGLIKKYKYNKINYNLIILLQKYGFCLSKNLIRVFLVKLFNVNY